MEYGRRKNGRKEKSNESEGQQEKYNAKYPGFREHLPCCSVPPCRLPPNLPTLPLFPWQKTLYTSATVSTGTAPLSLRGDFRGCSIVQRSRKGCLKYARLIFFSLSFQRDHLLFSSSPFLDGPAIVQVTKKVEIFVR